MSRMLFLLVAVVVVSAVTAPVLGQTGAIQGTASTSGTGQGGKIMGEDEVRANMQGNSTSSQALSYGRIYWDGVYRVPEGGTYHNSAGNMYPGTYSVGMSDEYEWRPRSYSYVKVANGATTACNITSFGTYEVRNQNGLTPSCTDLGQTFVARGGSIARLTLWHVPVACTIAFHQGGPGGPQVGAARSIGSGAVTQAWLCGEIPTVAGQTYYVNFHATGGGFATYRDQGGAYGQGQAYYNGIAQSTDLMMTLFEDCDGQGTFFKVHLAGTSTSNFYNTEVGQTFIAKGVNILSVSLRFRTAGADKNVLCSIHQGGPSGGQIGPTKATRIYDYSPVGQKVTWTWLPGEVPVTNGGTYYVKITCPEGIYVWCSTDNKYDYGRAWSGGVGQNGDLIGTIMGEITSGSSTCTIAGIVRDNGAPVVGATVSCNNCGYTTTTGADGRYSLTVTRDVYQVTCAKSGYASQTHTYNAFDGGCQALDYDLVGLGVIYGYVRDAYGNPIAGAAVSTSPGGYSGTSQASPAGYYSISSVPAGSYCVTACAGGYECGTNCGVAVSAGSSTPCGFSLAPKTALSNTGFETGTMSDWTNYGHGLWVQTGKGYGDITPHGGNRYAVNAASWTDPKTGGAYQRIWVPVGSPVTARVYAACYGEGGGAAHTFSRIGIDPYGGTNPAGASVQWSPYYNSPADETWQWTLLEKTTSALSNFVTVFLDYKQEGHGGSYAYAWQVNAFDDASTSGASLITVAQAKQRPGSSYVYVGPVVVTAKFGGAWECFYVQDGTAPAGIRVLGATSHSLGDAVRVGGILQSASGERAITPSIVQSVE